MRKVLLALDMAKGSTECVNACARLFAAKPPRSVILLHVQQLGGGPTLMHERMSDSEIETLREELTRTEAIQDLEAKSRALLEVHRRKLARRGIRGTKIVVRTGHVAEQILETARDERAEMIIIGNTRGAIAKLVMGDVVKAVANHSEVPVLLVR